MTFVRIALIALFGSGAAAATAVVGQSGDIPEAPGKAQIMESCTQCHGVDVLVQRRSPDEWSQVVSRMIGNGASLTDDQYKTVLDYLSTNLANAPAEQAAPPQAPAPAPH